MIPVKPDARRIILLEATIVTYLLILQDQRVEWEQQQKGRPTSTWCVPMCAAWVEILCITQIPGEYRINFISLLILLILLVSGNTYRRSAKRCVEEGEMWLWLRNPLLLAVMYSSMYISYIVPALLQRGPPVPWLLVHNQPTVAPSPKVHLRERKVPRMCAMTR